LQVNMIAERYFASWLPEGSISHLSYAFRLTGTPYVLFSFSFVTVLFPALISTNLAGDGERFSRLTINGVKVTSLVMIPSALFLIFFANPLVEILLQRGNFSAADTVVTASVIKGYSLGLPAMALAFMGTRIIIAMERSGVLIPASAVAMVATIGSCYVLVGKLGIQGLAVGAAFGSSVQAIYLWSRIYKCGDIPMGWKFGLRCLAGIAATAAFLQCPINLPKLSQVAIGGTISIICFSAVLWVLGERRLISPAILRFREEAL